MKTVNAYDVATVLVTKATALQSYLNNATYQGLVDDKSTQTWYGLPEGVIDDLYEAIDLVNIALNKIKTVTDPSATI